LAIAFCETVCLGEEEIIATNFGRNLFADFSRT
jgi:hypothetical protein